MSSNEYSVCVSRNLIRTSTSGYREYAHPCALLETAVDRCIQHSLPLAPMTVFPDFGTIGETHAPTAHRGSTSSRGSRAASQEKPNQI